MATRKKAATKKSKASKAVAKRASTEVSSAVDLAASAGGGQEGADSSSYAMPFFRIVQRDSPQMELGIDGLKPGMLINTVSNEFYEEARIIPCGFRRRYLRWAPKSSGRGFGGEVSPVEVETGRLPGLEYKENERGRQVPMVGEDELKDARMHFVLVETASGSWRPAIMSLGSTQIKKSKAWMSLIQSIEVDNPNGGKPINPASWSHAYTVHAVKEENSEGNWWGWVIQTDGPIYDDADLFNMGKALNEQVMGDEVIVKHDDEVSDSPSGGEGGDAEGRF